MPFDLEHDEDTYSNTNGSEAEPGLNDIEKDTSVEPVIGARDTPSVASRGEQSEAMTSADHLTGRQGLPRNSLSNFPTSTPLCEERVRKASPSAPCGQRVDRGHDGRFLPGNAAALVHGARSRQVAEGPALEDRISGLVEDLGGADAVSLVRRGAIARHARLELVEGHLWGNLADKGLTTGKGATRAAATLWLAVVDRLHKSAVLLGMERKAKPVQPLADILRGDQ